MIHFDLFKNLEACLRVDVGLWASSRKVILHSLHLDFAREQKSRDRQSTIYDTKNHWVDCGGHVRDNSITANLNWEPDIRYC